MTTRELFPAGTRPPSKKSKPKSGLREHEILMGVYLGELKLHYYREFLYHPQRAWRFDFCVPEHWLAIEIEGGLFVQGRHSRGAGYQGDLTKYQEAACLNWTVLRFSVEDVKTGRAKAVISRWLRRRNLPTET